MHLVHSLLSSLQLNRFVSVNKLKYFFAVDTAYVAKKLGLLVFPYTHQVSRQGQLPSFLCLPSRLVPHPSSLSACLPGRTGKCAIAEMCLCPHGKTSMHPTSTSQVSPPRPWLACVEYLAVPSAPWGPAAAAAAIYPEPGTLTLDLAQQKQ